MADRVTVDRAVRVRRHIDRRHQIARENAAAGLGKRRLLLGNDRRDPLPDQVERGIDAEQCAAESKAVFAELCHHASPRWSAMKAATAPASPSGSNGNGTAN